MDGYMKKVVSKLGCASIIVLGGASNRDIMVLLFDAFEKLKNHGQHKTSTWNFKTVLIVPNNDPYC